MSRGTPPTPRGESLISGRGLLALGAFAVLALVLLQDGVRRRLVEARGESPSSLSLAYLRLAMDESPEDEGARLTYVRAALEADRFDAARAALEPLLEDAPSRPVQRLQLEIERHAWLATPEQPAGAREAARKRYVSRLHVEAAHVADPRSGATLARTAEQAGAHTLAARLWREQVLRHGQLDDATLQAATASELARRRPLEAAALWEAAATGRQGSGARRAARRALTLAISADHPDAALAMLRRLRARFATDDALLGLGTRIADAAEQPMLAFELADARLALAPQSVERHAEMARRARWLSRVPRQLREEIWLAENAPSSAHRQAALETARAVPDFDAQLRLLGPLRPPFGREALMTRLELHEALGDVEVARALLDQGLASGLGDDPTLWQHRVALELASSREPEALATLQEMERRFGASEALTLQQAELLFRLDRGREAVGLLAAGLSADSGVSHAQLEKLGELAFQLAEAPTARRVYALAVRCPEATPLDFTRLHALLRAGGDVEGAQRLAEQALTRFETASFLELALEDARALGDEARAQALLDETGAPDHSLYYDMRFVALRVHSFQQRATRARAAQRLDRASQWLAQAESELLRPDVRQVIDHGGAAGSIEARLSNLQRTQRREELAVALASGDRGALARLYPQLEAELTATERVAILHQLGRDEQALAVGLHELDESSPTAETRARLTKDVDFLAASMPREIAATTGVDDYGELRSWWGRVGFEYARARWGARVALRFDQLVRDPGADLQLNGAHELRPELGAFLRRGTHRLDALVGLDARPSAGSRPYLSLRDATTLGTRGAQLVLEAGVNEVADDSAELRARGVRDTLHARAHLPLTAPVSFTLSAAAQLWSRRDDRSVIGSGATAEGAVIYHLLGRDGPWRLDLSGLARFAPRVAREQRNDADPPLPDGTTWLGSALALAHGDDRRLALRSRRVTFHLRGALGWLLPQNQAGYYAEGGLSAPLWGEDALSLRVHASNVVGNAPGQWVYGASVGYAHSLW